MKPSYRTPFEGLILRDGRTKGSHPPRWYFWHRWTRSETTVPPPVGPLDGEKARDLHAKVKGRKRKFGAVAPRGGTDADRGLAVLRDLERPRATGRRFQEDATRR